MSNPFTELFSNLNEHDMNVISKAGMIVTGVFMAAGAVLGISKEAQASAEERGIKKGMEAKQLEKHEDK